MNGCIQETIQMGFFMIGSSIIFSPFNKKGSNKKTGTKEITMQGCLYDPKGSFGTEKVGG